jgi:hypothetical protein
MDLRVREVPHGSIFSIVAEVTGVHDGCLHCSGLSPAQQFFIQGAPDIKLGIYTFYDLVRSRGDSPVCHFGTNTEALPHLPKKEFSKMVLFDVCSRMGGFTIGSQLLGVQTLAFIEKNSLACEALRANFTSPVIQGDLADIQVLKQVHHLKVIIFSRSQVASHVRDFHAKVINWVWKTIAVIVFTTF